MDIELLIGTIRAHVLMAIHGFGRRLQRYAERELRAELRYWEAKR